MSVKKSPFYRHHRQKVSVLPGHTDVLANQLLDGRSSDTAYTGMTDPVSLHTDVHEDWRDERRHGHMPHTCFQFPPEERHAEAATGVASAAAVAADLVVVHAAVLARVDVHAVVPPHAVVRAVVPR